ncbi:hypothetical protein AB0I51_17090 [Streptomyces sp. NPDC050549]|uniref:hypothetical protein n=1 Tax=Streptomyces sp. NPDC050549 TaxID=3155406 RepID=UPI0034252650
MGGTSARPAPGTRASRSPTPPSLDDSGSLDPGATERSVRTNRTSNTVTVRLYGDVAPHWVDVRLKGKIIA